VGGFTRFETERGIQVSSTKNKLTVAVAQISSEEDKEKNISTIKGMIEAGKEGKADIVCFPESSTYRGGGKKKLLSGELLDGASVREIAKSAETAQIFVMFSFLEQVKNNSKMFNTTVLISPGGEIVGTYRKIHLFDVILPNGEHAIESDLIIPGKELCIAQISEYTVGIMTCYDLRFPELARALTLGGAKVLFIPSDFTAETGKAHWEVLLRARAIENQVFIVAPNQMKYNSVTGIKSYGKSMVIDPWGVVVSVMPDEGGLMFAELDFNNQKLLREKFPVLEHIKIGEFNGF